MASVIKISPTLQLFFITLVLVLLGVSHCLDPEGREVQRSSDTLCDRITKIGQDVGEDSYLTLNDVEEMLNEIATEEEGRESA